MEGGDAEFPHLNIQSDISLQEPDLDQLRHDRMERNKAVMKVDLAQDEKNWPRIVNIFLPISFNICFGCSEEPSH